MALGSRLLLAAGMAMLSVSFANAAETGQGEPKPPAAQGTGKSGCEGAARTLSNKDKQKIADSVRLRLLDPESARFKWRPRPPNSNRGAYCGLVNSKNRLGGYVGDTPYAVAVVCEKGQVSFSALLALGEPEAAPQVCEKFGYGDVTNPYNYVK